MERPALEVADIFRDFGPAWRDANRGHVSHAQLKVMSAIEVCRTAALGGYVARCENAQCAHTVISYCSCRNRHCPKCQSSQALTWMEERKAELLQIPYFHIVFTLPAEIGAIAYQNKHAIYALLFKAASDTMLTIAADPKHLGAKIAITAVLHIHPHVHMIVTGGGISPDGSRWIASRPDYLVPVEVLSALFRGRMLGMLIDAHAAGRLKFFGDYQHLADTQAFRAYLGPLWTTDWFVYAKRPFAGPEQVLAYLSRYTHRVAISNSRLISADATGVTFKYKDYRIDGPDRYKAMTLEPGEFIRRFLMHVLPKGFHRIRHYGLLANGGAKRAEKLARARQLIAAAPQLAPPTPQPPHTVTCQDTILPQDLDHPCPHCACRMVIIEVFEAGCRPRHRPSAPASILGINSS